MWLVPFSLECQMRAAKTIKSLIWIPALVIKTESNWPTQVKRYRLIGDAGMINLDAAAHKFSLVSPGDGPLLKKFFPRLLEPGKSFVKKNKGKRLSVHISKRVFSFD